MLQENASNGVLLGAFSLALQGVTADTYRSVVEQRSSDRTVRQAGGVLTSLSVDYHAQPGSSASRQKTEEKITSPSSSSHTRTPLAGTQLGLRGLRH